jgi:hypothetical protein
VTTSEITRKIVLKSSVTASRVRFRMIWVSFGCSSSIATSSWSYQRQGYQPPATTLPSRRASPDARQHAVDQGLAASTIERGGHPPEVDPLRLERTHAFGD